MLINISRKLFPICILLGVISCSIYREAGERDKVEVDSALVRTPSAVYEENGKLITIESVDDNRPRVLQNAVVVSPGIHKLSILVEFVHDSKKKKDRQYRTKARADLEFPAAAQKEYLVDATENGEGLWLWIEEKKSGTVVGGSRP